MTTQITSFDQFVPLAIRTESKFATVHFNKALFLDIIEAGIAAGNLLDFVKKSVAYNKPIDQDKWLEFTERLDVASYFIKAATPEQVADKEDITIDPRLFHGIAGIATESAELLEALQLAWEQGNWDNVNLKEELFDVSWYISILLDELDESLYPLLDKGIQKLKARYPDKFTNEAAINRNLDVERKILEA